MIRDLVEEADAVFKKIIKTNEITEYDIRLKQHFRARYLLALAEALLVNAAIIFLCFYFGVWLCAEWSGPISVKALLVYALINYIPFICRAYLGYKGERFMKDMGAFFAVRKEWWKKEDQL